MISTKDYLAYMQENKTFFEGLAKHGVLTVSRLSDLFQLMEWIVQKASTNKELAEEIEPIFHTGFSYLYDQVEQIKTFYYNYFEHDFLLLEKYERYLNYYLMIESILYALKEASCITNNELDQFDAILTEIDDVMRLKKDPSLEKLDTFQQTIDAIMEGKPDVITILEAFSQVYEEVAYSE